MAKERYQNPTCNDTVNLRLFTYNSNNRSDVESIEKVEIYALDETLVSNENPQGLRLVQTIDGSSVTNEATGQYLLPLELTSPLYTIGRFLDVWHVIFSNGSCETAAVTNYFDIYSNLWFTTPIPPIYDFNFDFRPNKIRKGTKRYILIAVTPNVPRGSEIQKYYENLAVVSDLKVSIEIACGDCMPAEQDLRLLVDEQLVDYRDKGYAYYFLDTTEYDEGVYNIWFTLNYGENVFVSEKNSFQIYS